VHWYLVPRVNVYFCTAASRRDGQRAVGTHSQETVSPGDKTQQPSAQWTPSAGPEVGYSCSFRSLFNDVSIIEIIWLTLLERSESKIWTWVLWDPKSRTVLTSARANLAVRTHLSSIRRPPFQNTYKILNKKYSHGSRRGPKPRMTELVRARSNLINWRLYSVGC
jgi:hypothetical protein